VARQVGAHLGRLLTRLLLQLQRRRLHFRRLLGALGRNRADRCRALGRGVLQLGVEPLAALVGVVEQPRYRAGDLVELVRALRFNGCQM
jgi:hypothetical protein